ncbi:MAG: FtsQ-type POTRA domain-containing protein [Streptosporangiales bacterium]|nr:FtsQ-type POTRA domain-containing protein [Streptosporangiales bacterium]
MTTTGKSSARPTSGTRAGAAATGRGSGRRRGFTVVGLLLTLALVGGWLYLVYGSSVFAADDVQVVGAKRVPAKQVEAAAAVPLGTPLARVDLDQIEAQVLRLPRVHTVVVERAWPDTVRITVTEREPVAVVSRNGAWWVIDEEAVVLATTRKRPKLPELDVANPNPQDAATRSALAVLDRLPTKLGARVRSVSADTPDSVELNLPRSVVVVWGSADASAKKARVYRALRKVQPRGKVYDVSTPDTPTVTER